MKFLFIDESERQKMGTHKYSFCLCGLMIDYTSLIDAILALGNIKNNYDMTSFKDVRGKLARGKKREITEKIAGTLRGHKCIVLSSILGDIALGKVDEVDNCYFDAMCFLIERFFINLQLENAQGILVFDELDEKKKKKLKRKIFEYITMEPQKMRGKIKGYYRSRIFPEVLFSNDEFNVLLQVTDLIATSLNQAIWQKIKEVRKRRLTRGEVRCHLGEIVEIEELPKYSPYLEIYWPLFIKNPRNGTVSGWGIKAWW